MRPLKPALVFDYGGVLLEWNPRHLYRRIFNENEEEIETFLKVTSFAAWNAELDRGKPFEAGVTELVEQFPHYAEQIRAFDRGWEETIRGPIQPTVDLLERLHRSGYEIYGLSNWSREKFPIMRSRYAFFNLFKGMVISGEVGLIKPDARIYALLLEQVGRPAQECIFIDDSLTNITAALALGFDAIHYQTPRQLEEELAARGIDAL